MAMDRTAPPSDASGPTPHGGAGRLALLVLILAAPPAAGQTQLGFFGGVVDSSHPLGELTDRPTFGLVARRDLLDPLALEWNASYVRRGFKASDGRELKSDQGELALLLQVRPVRWGAFAPVVLTGASFSREIFCSARGVVGPRDRGPVLCEEFRDRAYDLGQIGGIALEIGGEVWTARLEFRRISEFAPRSTTRTAARRVSGYYVTLMRVR